MNTPLTGATTVLYYYYTVRGIFWYILFPYSTVKYRIRHKTRIQTSIKISISEVIIPFTTLFFYPTALSDDYTTVPYMK